MLHSDPAHKMKRTPQMRWLCLGECHSNLVKFNYSCVETGYITLHAKWAEFEKDSFFFTHILHSFTYILNYIKGILERHCFQQGVIYMILLWSCGLYSYNLSPLIIDMFFNQIQDGNVLKLEDLNTLVCANFPLSEHS